MTPLQQVLLDRIRRHGPMPFAAYMSLALYHPRHGYFTSGAGRTGWHGHFMTSPEVDVAFGELWARGFEQLWDACARPEGFVVVEIGPGEGTFAAAVLSSVRGAFAEAVSYRLIERVPALEERQRGRLERFDRVMWSRSLAEAPRIQFGCVFANEVLDNLPVHVVEKRNGALYEVCVEADADALVLTLRPPSSLELQRYLARVGVEVPDGHRFEIGLAAESLVRHGAASLETGALVIVDYGLDAPELARRAAGTLLSYSREGVDDRFLDEPGARDITAHVNWTAVSAACRSVGLDVVGPRPQRAVLNALGISSIDARLRDEHHAALAAGRGANAVRALSRRQGLGVLSDPAGLGGLQVMVGLAGVDPPPFLR